MSMQVLENINDPTYFGLLFGPQNINVNKTGQLQLPDYNVSQDSSFEKPKINNYRTFCSLTRMA